MAGRGAARPGGKNHADIAGLHAHGGKWHGGNGRDGNVFEINHYRPN